MSNSFRIFPADTGTLGGQGPINAAPGVGVYKTLLIENLGPETAWLNKVHSLAAPFPDNYLTDRDVLALGAGDKATIVVTGSEQYWYGTYSPGATLLVTEKTP